MCRKVGMDEPAEFLYRGRRGCGNSIFLINEPPLKIINSKNPPTAIAVSILSVRRVSFVTVASEVIVSY